MTRTFRTCQLYSYETHQWLTFAGVPTTAPVPEFLDRSVWAASYSCGFPDCAPPRGRAILKARDRLNGDRAPYRLGSGARRVPSLDRFPRTRRRVLWVGAAFCLTARERRWCCLA